jgi:glucose/arabinose dehydrogenase
MTVAICRKFSTVNSLPKGDTLFSKSFKTMKPYFLLATILLAAMAPSLHAQQAAKALATVAPVSASKTALVTGLKEAQGLALDKNGHILVAEYKSGKILRFARDGKPLGALTEALKSPAMMVTVKGALIVADRQNNRVVRVDKNGKVVQLGGEIAEPLGVTAAPDGTLFVVSHTTSKVYRFDGKAWQPIYIAPPAPDGEKRYGYRCLAYDNGALLMSDESSGHIFVLTQGGRLTPWSKEIDNPSGVTIGPDGAVYATNEGNGGQLLKLASDGTFLVVAEGLGRPRDVLFLDARQALISDRNGTLWQITLP